MFEISVNFEDTQKSDHNLKSSLHEQIQSFIDSHIVIYLFILHCLLGDLYIVHLNRVQGSSYCRVVQSTEQI